MLQSIFSKRSLSLKPSGGQRLSSNWIVIALLLITVLAAALRIYRLDARGLWADEIFTAIFASADNDLAAVAQRSLSTPIPSPPLWFFITHFFVKALGSSEAVLRLPSVIAGVLGILAVYKVGEALFDRTVGLISAFLLAVSPFHLHYSQEARCYAGVVLLSLLTLYFLYRGMNSNEKKWWVGFTIATLANLYINLTAFLVLIVEILYACLLLMHRLVAARRTGATRRLSATFALPLLISLGVITAGYVPMVPHIIRGIQGPRGLGNPDDVQGLRLSVKYFFSLLSRFGAGTGIPLSLYMASFLWGLIGAVHKQKRQGLLILLWTVVPFAIVLLLRPKHWFVPKYVIFILPLYLVTVSLGITYVAKPIALFLSQWNVLRSPRFLSALSLAALVAIYGLTSISGLNEVYAQQTGRWREIAQFLDSNMQPEDAVASFPLSSVLLTISGQEIMSYYGPRDVVEVSSQDQLEDLMANHRRVWIVKPGGWADPDSEFRTSVLADLSYIELPLEDGALVLYTGKDHTQLSLLEEAKRFTNLTAEAHGSIAEVYRSLGMWEEAQAAYAQAAAMEPDQGIWHYHRATLYEEQGQHDEALTEYQQATRPQPEMSDFHTLFGDSYPDASQDRSADHSTDVPTFQREVLK